MTHRIPKDLLSLTKWQSQFVNKYPIIEVIYSTMQSTRELTKKKKKKTNLVVIILLIREIGSKALVNDKLDKL